MKLYILGPVLGGEGVYQICTEYGEPLANHFCSHAGYARGDLEGNRPERQVEWRERFGDYEIEWLQRSGVSFEELKERNAKWLADQEATQRAEEAREAEAAQRSGDG